MLNKILEHMSSTKEPFFEYFNLQDNYEISINFIQKEIAIPPHTHKQDVFNYVFKGEFSISLDDFEKTYKKGEWISIPAGTIHSLNTKSEVILLELWKR
jgi:quercetin dioxygenase-like cupin family protein